MIKLSVLNDVKLMRIFKHNNILKFDSLYETKESIIFLMELAEGGQLAERIKKKVIQSEQEVAFVLLQLLDALIYINSLNILHRDIKPQNIILKGNPDDLNVVLGDFGLATRMDDDYIVHLKCGTPGFCAPEILKSKAKKLNYGKKCDLFSLGCVFYQM